MTSTPERTPLAGSARPAAATGTTPLPTGTRAEVTLVLRRVAALPTALVEGPDVLAPAALAQRHGAAASDVDLVTAALRAAGFDVLESDPASRRVVAGGDAAALAGFFGTTLTSGPDGSRRREGELSLPTALAGVVTAVLGLDDRPQTSPRTRAVPSAAVSTSYPVPELAAVYGFPPAADGSGTTLAILELGGGYGADDVAAYFAGVGVREPAVRAGLVDGARNLAGADPQGADGEVLLDIEVAGALAPGASLVVWFAPNTDRGFLDGVSAAVHATPTPAALSISWGQAEDQWTAQARQAMDDAFADAAALGVVVTVAAGDDGSADRESDGATHVDFPAASPHVLACGGTALHLSGTQVTSEVVWGGTAGGGATGGGVSSAFAQPPWQAGVGVPGAGRGVPDVAAVADPATGYQVRVDGAAAVIGGTSAVAPLWAALACRLTQALGRPLGLLAPQLYAGATAGEPVEGCRDITTGSNGAYRAGPGWDACTGLGVPVGEALLARLRAAGSAAG